MLEHEGRGLEPVRLANRNRGELVERDRATVLAAGQATEVARDVPVAVEGNRRGVQSRTAALRARESVARRGAAQERHDGGEAREELEVEDRVVVAGPKAAHQACDPRSDLDPAAVFDVEGQHLVEDEQPLGELAIAAEGQELEARFGVALTQRADGGREELQAAETPELHQEHPLDAPRLTQRTPPTQGLEEQARRFAQEAIGALQALDGDGHDRPAIVSAPGLRRVTRFATSPWAGVVGGRRAAYSV